MSEPLEARFTFLIDIEESGEKDRFYHYPTQAVARYTLIGHSFNQEVHPSLVVRCMGMGLFVTGAERVHNGLGEWRRISDVVEQIKGKDQSARVLTYVLDKPSKDWT